MIWRIQCMFSFTCISKFLDLANLVHQNTKSYFKIGRFSKSRASTNWLLYLGSLLDALRLNFGSHFLLLSRVLLGTLPVFGVALWLGCFQVVCRPLTSFILRCMLNVFQFYVRSSPPSGVWVPRLCWWHASCLVCSWRWVVHSNLHITPSFFIQTCIPTCISKHMLC